MMIDGVVLAALVVTIAAHAAAVVIGVVVAHRMRLEVAALQRATALLAAAHERATGEPVPVPSPLEPWFARTEPETDVILRGAPRPWQITRDAPADDQN